VLAFHAELDSHSPPSHSAADPTRYATFLASRPPDMEVSAIALVARLSARFPALRTHIVHLSAAGALPLVRQVKQTGARLSAETCFHYLALEAPTDGDDSVSHEHEHGTARIPDRAPQFKCCPPIRGASNRTALWSALADETLGMVVSDHSPCTPDLKHLGAGDIMSAWGGISGLGLGLSLLWTEARARGFGIADVIRWTADGPAKHAALDDHKGALAVGKDADLCMFDPDATFTASIRHALFCHASDVRCRSRRIHCGSRTSSLRTRAGHCKASSTRPMCVAGSYSSASVRTGGSRGCLR
jgi:allantoinase